MCPSCSLNGRVHDVEAVDPKSTLANNTITTLAKVPRKIDKVKASEEKLLGSFPKRQGSLCGSQYRVFATWTVKIPPDMLGGGIIHTYRR